MTNSPINALSINNPAAFIWSLENTLERVEKAKDARERRAILDRQTVQGIKWAIEFMSSRQTVWLSEKELQHAIRLTMFRGSSCPNYNN